jgi:hypothetical protein
MQKLSATGVWQAALKDMVETLDKRDGKTAGIAGSSMS